MVDKILVLLVFFIGYFFFLRVYGTGLFVVGIMLFSVVRWVFYVVLFLTCFGVDQQQDESNPMKMVAEVRYRNQKVGGFAINYCNIFC
jgi:hypothetical protein